ncbi:MULTISPECIES: phage major tail tube protein [Pontibacillus]|uniref:Phage major tail tube protein n=1 Tax=Pontibacillus chungwhensis TaxID=265426 RepID=A0ABY8V3X5_9BACI|nr:MULTISPECIES: phage major tail tube protein [Pontibacillus]MCD5324777.1 phage major tail tube protein [Pontibacillus sp. HN14]WIG00124.1 phage major tail tube protein [Pontibacillus chungwhensis]
MNKIPEKLINYSVYREGAEWLGTADVELPSLEALSETLKGAGIAGEVDSPVLGHYAAMTATLNWRTMNKSQFKLAAQKSHALDFRGAMQVFDAGSGTYEPTGVRVSIRGVPKTTGIGKFEVGATTDSSNELSVSYLKIEVDGERIVEIDQFNYIAFIDGEDVLEKVRQILGQ